ncbi:hypothetical protein VOLCADRAFT_91752 [Volvox carteri f. nagariensis]|uniref:FAS1 domain-containing protein n=1 Tax=Volvox carteri f. nagariensis TaxID=3068 RepID=D8TXV7_VOLCA|nr:uncharacterized protein VOLCADRAFT_91752 [Volvox carteri f. nagariensis]EFJ47711.1 hypothetical protein VOLCADRAFT_91752 [Volvox carteri f. nagariensis]|eukprot:XP_002951182.1 hypothetical protein VOLCADRAFT_91752 [Volvox carteri f. nagariensis]
MDHRKLLCLLLGLITLPAIASAANTLVDALGDANSTVFGAALNLTSTYAGLLVNGKFKGTILAPTDDAFAVYITSLGISPTSLMAQTVLIQQVLDLHFIPDVNVSLATVQDGAKFTTKNGENTIKVQKFSNGTVTFVSANSTATALYEYNIGGVDSGRACILHTKDFSS